MPASSPGRPNVLILISDQLRRQALGCYGDRDARTPRIDRLAGEGVRFERACSTYPLCVPFRFTLWTGVPAHARLIPALDWRISPYEPTLADEFNAAGYETVYIGKWHLSGDNHPKFTHRSDLTGRMPVPRELQGRWQHWYGFDVRNAPFDTVYFRDDDPTPIPIEGYQTDGLCDLALEHLRNRSAESPFCMVVSVEPPHPPFEAPRELVEAWLAREIELPPNVEPASDEEREALLRERKLYYAMVENLDANVGRMLDYLEASGEAGNTVVLFLSDHGELAGSHGLRNKQFPYEESVGIPLLARVPGAPAGRVLEAPLCTEDLFPTILGLAGLACERPLVGLDWSETLRGGHEPEREAVLLEFVAEHRPQMPFFNKSWRGVRTKRYKYVVLGELDATRPWQLFDLEADPYERNNLVDDPAFRQLRRELHETLRRLLSESGDYFVLPPAEA